MKNFRIWVLRLSHRSERDKRLTSHVALAARAFGADGMYFSGDYDENVIKTVRKITENWGGDFKTEYVSDPLELISEWREKGGEIIHLTMYGLPIREVVEEIRRSWRDKLVIVGSEKVPGVIFKLADWNIAITSQPHSEVSALAVFLHELFRGEELNLDFKNAKLKIIPQKRGKKVMKTDQKP